MKREAWIYRAAAVNGLVLLLAVFCVWQIIRLAIWVWPHLPEWATRPVGRGLALADYPFVALGAYALVGLAHYVLFPLYRLMRVPDDVLDPEGQTPDYPFKSQPKTLEEIAKREAQREP
ncbi:hypothetical protein D3C86_1656910 [compost metagenome]